LYGENVGKGVIFRLSGIILCTEMTKRIETCDNDK